MARTPGSRIVTELEILEAQRLRRRGYGWRSLGRKMGREQSVMRKAVKRAAYFNPKPQ